MSPDIRQVERAYAAMQILEAGPGRAEGTLGLHELTNFVFDPDFVLSDAQMKWLSEDPAAEQARSALAALQARSAFAAVPSVAAASDGEVLERTFDGISIRVTIEENSPVAGLLVVFPESRRPAGAVALIMSTGSEGIAKLRLPKPDDRGESYRNLNVERSEAYARFLRILRDPNATGSIHAID